MKELFERIAEVLNRENPSLTAKIVSQGSGTRLDISKGGGGISLKECLTIEKTLDSYNVKTRVEKIKVFKNR